MMLGELGEVSFWIMKLGEVNFGIMMLGELGETSFGF